MTKRLFPVLCLCWLSIFAWAQGGSSVYSFLELPYFAHSAALGGTHVALVDDGVGGAMANPALLSDKTHKQLAINYSNYLFETNIGAVAYGYNIGTHRLAAAIEFLSYGSFEGRDEANRPTGDFSAKDFALNLSYGKQLDKNLNAGITLKPIFSTYENYSSFALAVDAGIAYIDTAKGISIGLTFSNIGHQLSSFTGDYEELPFNSALSFSKKFPHAPLRVHLTAHHLHVWDLNYSDRVTSTNLTGDEIKNKISFGDMLLRHTIVGVDFEPGKVIYLTASYNHRRAAELKLQDSRSMAGFSFGGGLRLSKIRLDFGMSQYQKGVWAYQFSLSSKLSSFSK
ncbi:MAG: type IX secretion system protein PorQ [Prevotellaceae bacterium]|jgi:hypothetical protein|nr:type IX secretion system protein PorQ [Prevotellaceae bacterium]